MRTLVLAIALAALPCALMDAQETAPDTPSAETQDPVGNVNDRYVLSGVEVAGVPSSRVSQTVRDDMKDLVGLRPDAAEVADVEARLAAEFPDYEVRRRMSRGDEPGQLRLEFELTRRADRRPLQFAELGSKLVYHSDLAWGGALDIALGGPNHRVTLGFLAGDDDRLAEEVTGVGLRLESRNLGTERLGVSFEIARHRQTWDPATLSVVAVSPHIPEPYRKRLFVEPVVRFAVVPGVHARGGVSLSELESLSRSPDSSFAGAALAGFGVDRQWRGDVFRHDIHGDYEVRTGTSRLESDFEYTRHLVTARYGAAAGRRRFGAAFMFGRTSGTAPLFERFTLGDSLTLRGWNRLDVAPAGGERMIHQSVQYSDRGFTVFLDTGAVTGREEPWRLRASAGMGYQAGPFHVLLGFPLNAGEVRAALMIGTGLSVWRF